MVNGLLVFVLGLRDVQCSKKLVNQSYKHSFMSITLIIMTFIMQLFT